MMLYGFVRILDGVHRMTVSYVRVMACFNVIAVIVMASRFPMVFCRVLVVLGGFEVVLNAFVLRHVISPL